jgi:hypothetical protein
VTVRLLVCGGRDFDDQELLDNALGDVTQTIGRSDVLIHGGARGADRLAGEWAKRFGIPVMVFPADWETHGRRAGYLRNRQMLVEGEPTHVVAMPGGRGTADMLRQARLAGVPTRSYSWAAPPTR